MGCSIDAWIGSDPHLSQASAGHVTLTAAVFLIHKGLAH